MKIKIATAVVCPNAKKWLTVMAAMAVLFGAALGAAAQFQASDPGVRQGRPGAGGMRSGLSWFYQQFFAASQTRFEAIDSVSGKEPGSTRGAGGLGPRFNGISCSGCHIQPAIGGSSPAFNPQIGFATAFGANNQVPGFIFANGPVREVRFKNSTNESGEPISGSPDGGVHDLFTVTGMRDAGGCSLAQPSFDQQVAQNNVIFRIPTPVFGLGLVEEISESQLTANLASDAWRKASLGISGTFNRSGNDGTITRFGWKAQNKSGLMFAGEAYNVEMGVTNDVMPNERPSPGETLPNSCLRNPINEDLESGPAGNSGFPSSDLMSDIVNFAMFMRLTAPPTPSSPTPDTQRGAQVFVSVGCNECHTPSITTGTTSAITGETNVAVNAFSDFALHHMGQGLADGVTQGLASPDQFRTAPLWGVGQRIFFLHDGRTSDLLQAIQAHASSGSEANGSIGLFNGLNPSQQQSLLDFLRSL
jgi:CxxC motif-containing protein (DUF1111 family)